MGQNIGGVLASIGGMYAENKALDAKAKGYDHVGRILGDSMFKNDPAVGAYLSELRSVKNPMERIAGYETLFNMAGPLSNAMMAQGRIGVTQQGQQQATTRMYEQETLRRERDTINNPPAPAPVSVPQGMRRFNAPTTTN